MYQVSTLIQSHAINKKYTFIILTILLMGLSSLSASPVSLAQDPNGNSSEAPTFERNVYTAQDNSASISSHQTILDVSYFQTHGTLDGLIISDSGLTLATDATNGSYTTDPVASPMLTTTDMVPTWRVTLPPDSNVSIETRLSTDGGVSWSSWAKNPEAFYPVRNDEHGGTMVWIGRQGSVSIQFRISLQAAQSTQTPIFHYLNLVFSDSSQGPTDASIMAQLPFESNLNSCPVERPPVVSRTQWGSPDGQNSPRWTPQPTNVTHVVIQHTATPNNLSAYGVGDWAAVVRSIWNYHANTLGWGDVGYNYLIDPQGTIYEGRAGGQNGQSNILSSRNNRHLEAMSLAFIGCYGNCESMGLSSGNPPHTMVNKGVELIAWQLGEKGLDPHNNTNFQGTLIPTIAGGRDVADTDSPGDILYNTWLPWIRNAVADRVACTPQQPQSCQVTAIEFDKPSYNLNDTINFVAKLADPLGNPLPNATVLVDVFITALNNNQYNLSNIDDHTGEYAGVYDNTTLAGTYNFQVNATHPDFQSCSLTKSVQVGNGTPTNPTPTPSNPTPTPTNPTPTPLPTSTPPPSPVPSTAVKFNPSPVTIPSCVASKKIELRAIDVSNLSAFSFKLKFNPAIVGVLDADPNQNGIQILLGEAFRNKNNFVAINKVDEANGLIEFAVTLVGSDSVNGDIVLVEIDWTPQQAGTTDLTFNELDLVGVGGTEIGTQIENGSVTVTDTCSGTSGKIELQGRSDYAGIVITDDQGNQTQTQSDGSFSIAGNSILMIKFPGYLSAKATVANLVSAEDDAQIASIGSITLLAGDVNGDETINIFDLAYLATRYRSTDATADLNADGTVNIFDLTMAASNYRQQGPLTNWQ